MLSTCFKWFIVLFLFSCINLADLGSANPIILKDDNIVESAKEADDLITNNLVLKDSGAKKSFAHRDEDMLADLKQSTIFSSLKYDVEILESGEAKKEDMEIEERYRGPAITLNTDNFVNENIEVSADNGDLETSDSKERLASNHLILNILLSVLSLLAIGLFIALVIYRNYIQERYGMRELLVSRDNQEYWPQEVIASVFAQRQQQYQQRQQQSQS